MSFRSQTQTPSASKVAGVSAKDLNNTKSNHHEPRRETRNQRTSTKSPAGTPHIITSIPSPSGFGPSSSSGSSPFFNIYDIKIIQYLIAISRIDSYLHSLPKLVRKVLILHPKYKPSTTENFQNSPSVNAETLCSVPLANFAAILTGFSLNLNLQSNDMINTLISNNELTDYQLSNLKYHATTSSTERLIDSNDLDYYNVDIASYNMSSLISYKDSLYLVQQLQRVALITRTHYQKELNYLMKKRKKVSNNHSDEYHNPSFLADIMDPIDLLHLSNFYLNLESLTSFRENYDLNQKIIELHFASLPFLLRFIHLSLKHLKNLIHPYHVFLQNRSTENLISLPFPQYSIQRIFAVFLKILELYIIIKRFNKILSTLNFNLFLNNSYKSNRTILVNTDETCINTFENYLKKFNYCFNDEFEKVIYHPFKTFSASSNSLIVNVDNLTKLITKLLKNFKLVVNIYNVLKLFYNEYLILINEEVELEIIAASPNLSNINHKNTAPDDSAYSQENLNNLRSNDSTARSSTEEAAINPFNSTAHHNSVPKNGVIYSPLSNIQAFSPPLNMYQTHSKSNSLVSSTSLISESSSIGSASANQSNLSSIKVHNKENGIASSWVNGKADYFDRAHDPHCAPQNQRSPHINGGLKLSSPNLSLNQHRKFTHHHQHLRHHNHAARNKSYSPTLSTDTLEANVDNKSSVVNRKSSLHQRSYSFTANSNSRNFGITGSNNNGSASISFPSKGASINPYDLHSAKHGQRLLNHISAKTPYSNGNSLKAPQSNYQLNNNVLHDEIHASAFLNMVTSPKMASPSEAFYSANSNSGTPTRSAGELSRSIGNDTSGFFKDDEDGNDDYNRYEVSTVRDSTIVTPTRKPSKIKTPRFDSDSTQTTPNQSTSVMTPISSPKVALAIDLSKGNRLTPLGLGIRSDGNVLSSTGKPAKKPASQGGSSLVDVEGSSIMDKLSNVDFVKRSKSISRPRFFKSHSNNLRIVKANDASADSGFHSISAVETNATANIVSVNDTSPTLTLHEIKNNVSSQDAILEKAGSSGLSNLNSVHSGSTKTAESHSKSPTESGTAITESGSYNDMSSYQLKLAFGFLDDPSRGDTFNALDQNLKTIVDKIANSSSNELNELEKQLFPEALTNTELTAENLATEKPCSPAKTALSSKQTEIDIENNNDGESSLDAQNQSYFVKIQETFNNIKTNRLANNEEPVQKSNIADIGKPLKADLRKSRVVSKVLDASEYSAILKFLSEEDKALELESWSANNDNSLNFTSDGEAQMDDQKTKSVFALDDDVTHDFGREQVPQSTNVKSPMSIHFEKEDQKKLEKIYEPDDSNMNDNSVEDLDALTHSNSKFVSAYLKQSSLTKSLSLGKTHSSNSATRDDQAALLANSLAVLSKDGGLCSANNIKLPSSSTGKAGTCPLPKAQSASAVNLPYTKVDPSISSPEAQMFIKGKSLDLVNFSKETEVNSASFESTLRNLSEQFKNNTRSSHNFSLPKSAGTAFQSHGSDKSAASPTSSKNEALEPVSSKLSSKSASSAANEGWRNATADKHLPQVPIKKQVRFTDSGALAESDFSNLPKSKLKFWTGYASNRKNSSSSTFSKSSKLPMSEQEALVSHKFSVERISLEDRPITNGKKGDDGTLWLGDEQISAFNNTTVKGKTQSKNKTHRDEKDNQLNKNFVSPYAVDSSSSVLSSNHSKLKKDGLNKSPSKKLASKLKKLAIR